MQRSPGAVIRTGRRSRSGRGRTVRSGPRGARRARRSAAKPTSAARPPRRRPGARPGIRDPRHRSSSRKENEPSTSLRAPPRGRVPQGRRRRPRPRSFPRPGLTPSLRAGTDSRRFDPVVFENGIQTDIENRKEIPVRIREILGIRAILSIAFRTARRQQPPGRGQTPKILPRPEPSKPLADDFRFCYSSLPRVNKGPDRW